MIWFVPFAIAAFLIWREMLFGWAHPTDAVEWALIPVMATFVTLIPGGICLGLAFLCGLPFHAEPTLSSTDQLVALREKDGIQGTFFLGTGTINDVQYCFYYERNRDGSFSPGKVRMGDWVRIYEEDRQDATMETSTWNVRNQFVWFIGIASGEGGHSYDFHVPRGTIKQGYSL